MLKPIKKFFFSHSLRLNLIAVLGVVLLLSGAMGVMFYFSHKALHRESKLAAEETLELTAQQVDNILLCVEQATGNIYSELVNHLNEPERMYTYSRKLVECSPYVSGCAICFKPNYYPGREQFMTYVHRKDDKDKKSQLVTSEKFGSKPYTEYLWYSIPMTTGEACWTDPMSEEEDEGVTLSFCLPIFTKNRECVGVLVADLLVSQLSQLVSTGNSLADKYNVLLASNGSFIVRPDLNKQKRQTVYTLTEKDYNSALSKITRSMMAGETGDTLFRANSQDWYVFYKPFLQNKHSSRAMSRLNWSVAVVYSEAEIFGSFNYMLLYVLVISVTGLFLFFLLIRIVARLQMQPVRLLSKATQRIAEGHYDDSMPDIRRNDEIGLLYQRFQLMEQSLAAHVNELGQLTTTLKKRREVLREINAKEQSVDRVKTSFLHFVTNQMIAPSESIQRYINILCHHYIELSPEEISQVVDSIEKKSDTVIELINNMLEAADSEAGKEAAHD